MAKNGTEFSKYAQAFHEDIDGKKTNNDILTRDLLKMGLTDNDKAFIDDEFPTYIDDEGVRHFEGNKGGTGITSVGTSPSDVSSKMIATSCLASSVFLSVVIIIPP